MSVSTLHALADSLESCQRYLNHPAQPACVKAHLFAGTNSLEPGASAPKASSEDSLPPQEAHRGGAGGSSKGGRTSTAGQQKATTAGVEVSISY